jgi:hypothetical protein
MASPTAIPRLVAATHPMDSDGNRDLRINHWTNPRAAPAMAPAMNARTGVSTGTTKIASNPAIGKLRNAKPQKSRKRREGRTFFMVDSFDGKTGWM